MWIDNISIVLLLLGCGFFISGVVGLLRLPDVYCRLHALTKADNVGLGCIMLALLLQAEQMGEVVRLLFIWLLILVASAGACSLVAQAALRHQGSEGQEGQDQEGQPSHD